MKRSFFRFVSKISTKKEKVQLIRNERFWLEPFVRYFIKKARMKGITINMVASIIILFAVFIILVALFIKMKQAIPSPV